MNYYIILSALLFVYMSAWFCISLRLKRNDVADIAWGLGFVFLSWAGYVMSAWSTRSLIVNALVSVWGVRLALHIFRRNRGKPEDRRYAKWREEWGRWVTVRSYLQVFLLQGIFLFLIASPVLIIHGSDPAPLGMVDGLGILVWLIGFAFESIGDAQLTRFVQNPANKGKIIRTGLWRYSRHPNYFGEVTQWWGIFVLALAVPNGIISVIGPLTITVLILFVSGVPLLEQRYASRPDFEAYKRETSMFVPLPPRRNT